MRMFGGYGMAKTLPSKIKAQNEYEIVFHRILNLAPLFSLVSNLVTENFVCCSVVFFSSLFCVLTLKILCVHVYRLHDWASAHTRRRCVWSSFPAYKNASAFVFFLRSIISIPLKTGSYMKFFIWTKLCWMSLFIPIIRLTSLWRCLSELEEKLWEWPKERERMRERVNVL